MICFRVYRDRRDDYGGRLYCWNPLTHSDIFKDAVHPIDLESEDMMKVLSAENYYSWYSAIASQLWPERILEIGVRFGYSAIALCGDLAEDYVGIDHEWWEDSNVYAEKVIGEKCDVNVTLLTANSQDLPEERLEGQDLFDLAHVDGNHTPGGMCHDLRLVDANLCDGGLIIVDDMKDRELYRYAVNFAGIRGYPVQYLPSLTGTLLIWKEQA